MSIKNDKQITIPNFKPIAIKSTSDLSKATEILSKLNKLKDKILADKEKLTKPLNEALRNIRLKYKPAEEKLQNAIDQIRKEMSSYQNKVLLEQEASKDKLKKDLANGKITPNEAILTLANTKDPNARLNTENGSIKFVAQKRIKSINIKLLPIEYHLANEVLIRKDMLSGKTIKGVEYETIQVPVNRKNY